jgi:hypothetical protein
MFVKLFPDWLMGCHVIQPLGRFRFSVTWFLMYTQISSFGASVAFVFFSSAGFCHVLEAMTCLHKYVNWSIISLSTSCFIFRDNNNYHMACVLLMCKSFYVRKKENAKKKSWTCSFWWFHLFCWLQFVLENSVYHGSIN